VYYFLIAAVVMFATFGAIKAGSSICDRLKSDTESSRSQSKARTDEMSLR
jgi:hypothetical protein